MRRTSALPLVLGLMMSMAAAAWAADWPQWGGRNERNFASDEKNLPLHFRPASEKTEGDQKISIPAENIKWVAKLGNQTYGNPTVANGRVFIGTNDANFSDDRLKKSQGGLILCLDEATGTLLWQLPVPRLRTKNSSFNFDNINLGICSSPTVDGDCVYLTSNRGEVLCLSIFGQARGNQGPFKDEGRYMVGPGELPDKPGRFDPASAPPPPAPVEVRPTDGDILWLFDSLTELDCWPQDAVDCSVLVHGDYVYTCPSNGVDKSHKNIPSPNCPDLVVLDKKTGKLLAKNDPVVGRATFHGEWSSPTLAKAGDKDLIVWGGGDGFCYAFDPRFEPGQDGRPGVLKQVWKFDCNTPALRLRDGKPLLYNKNHEGPSEVIGTPVFYKGRLYVTVGQDSRHGNGPGCLSCIDPTRTGDITETGKVWKYEQIHRSFSTVSAYEGLIYAADYAGIVHCLDADTGQCYWTHDLGAHTWASTLAADGKVYIGDEKGKLTILAASKEKKVLNEIQFDAPLYSSPIVANGVLYITSQTHLYAVQEKK